MLRSSGLIVRRRRGTVNHVRQHDYYLTQHGDQIAQRVVSEAPVFSYYVERVALVVALADGLGGTALKKRQPGRPSELPAIPYALNGSR